MSDYDKRIDRVLLAKQSLANSQAFSPKIQDGYPSPVAGGEAAEQEPLPERGWNLAGGSERSGGEAAALTLHKVMTLPLDSQERKEYAIYRGCLMYFPAAIAGVARTSKLGNDKHNLGQEMHHARGKSTDHGDCILRHLMDVSNLLAARSRGFNVTDADILNEVNQMTWRALAFSQELHEQLGSPLAPGAKLCK